MAAGKLSIVATPIGNLGDLTFRALWNLKECTVVYAEDTRVILKLLNHYGLRKSVFRLDAATESRKSPEVIERLSKGEHIAYVTDAGTPGPGAPPRSPRPGEIPKKKDQTLPGPSGPSPPLSHRGEPREKIFFS